MDKINIEEVSTIYNIKSVYHSDDKNKNYDAQIEAAEEADGTISFKPNHCGHSFEFYHSDPDRVIAIARMLLSFAQMVKNEQKNIIDTNAND